MSTDVKCTWQEGMKFESVVTGHTVIMDADADTGGTNMGPRPKPLLLTALGGCTGMDVIAILKRMELSPSWFDVSLSAETTERHPKYYDSIKITYRFKQADELDPAVVEKAVKLSQERYCGVSAMLAKAAEIDYEIVYE